MNEAVRPMLPLRRPTWLLVLAVMLVFGFYQEKAKIQLNHYAEVIQQNPELCEMSPEMRTVWWNENPQPRRIHYYIMRGTWSGFHGMSLTQLKGLKWGLSVAILLIFFAILLLFGGKKIPELMRGVGKGIREFNSARSTIEEELKQGMKEVEGKKKEEDKSKS